MSRQRIYLGVGEREQLVEVLVDLKIEGHNREGVKEVLNEAVNLIYDGEYDIGGKDE